MLPSIGSLASLRSANISRMNMSKRRHRMSKREYTSELQRATTSIMVARGSPVSRHKRVAHWDTEVTIPYFFDSHPNPLGTHPVNRKGNTEDRRSYPSWMRSRGFQEFTDSLMASGIQSMATDINEVEPQTNSSALQATRSQPVLRTASSRRLSMLEPLTLTPTPVGRLQHRPRRMLTPDNSSPSLRLSGNVKDITANPPQFVLPQFHSFMEVFPNTRQREIERDKKIPISGPRAVPHREDTHGGFLSDLAEVNFSASSVEASIPPGGDTSRSATSGVEYDNSHKKPYDTHGPVVAGSYSQRAYFPKKPSGTLLRQPMLLEDHIVDGSGSLGASVPSRRPTFRQASQRLSRSVRCRTGNFLQVFTYKAALSKDSITHKINPVEDLNMEEYPKSHRGSIITGPKAQLYFSSPTKENPRQYRRTMDTETPMPKVPSCIGLPPGWTKEHDRFIAYLATHAPLDSGGRPEKALGEFHTYGQISNLLRIKFHKFAGSPKIQESTIEKRLDMLELLDNNYFSMEYGAYAFEDWGSDL